MLEQKEVELFFLPNNPDVTDLRFRYQFRVPGLSDQVYRRRGLCLHLRGDLPVIFHTAKLKYYLPKAKACFCNFPEREENRELMLPDVNEP